VPWPGGRGTRRCADWSRNFFARPIPEYDNTDQLHRDLAAAVDLTGASHFTTKRRAIRDALAADGIAAEMEAMVDALLPP
jgi:hypothetical protein